MMLACFKIQRLIPEFYPALRAQVAEVQHRGLDHHNMKAMTNLWSNHTLHAIKSSR